MSIDQNINFLLKFHTKKELNKMAKDFQANNTLTSSQKDTPDGFKYTSG